MSVLRNEPFATESIFREPCLLSGCLVAYDPHCSRLYLHDTSAVLTFHIIIPEYNTKLQKE